MKFIRFFAAAAFLSLICRIGIQILSIGVKIERLMFVEFYADNATLSNPLNTSLQKICTKLNEYEFQTCNNVRARVYTPKIMPSWHVPFVNMVSKRTFFPEAQTAGMDAKTLEFILAHELGHILGRDKESDADTFAAQLVGAETAIEALERAAVIWKWANHKSLSERIAILRSLKSTEPPS